MIITDNVVNHNKCYFPILFQFLVSARSVCIYHDTLRQSIYYIMKARPIV